MVALRNGCGEEEDQMGAESHRSYNARQTLI